VKNKNPVLENVSTFATYLKSILPHHRIDFLYKVAYVLFGIIQAKSTRHADIAIHLGGDASIESKTKAVARTFHDAGLSETDILKILLPLLPDGKLIFVMDRTNWQHGQTPINILALGVVFFDVVIPLVREVLDHRGNSNTATRIVLVQRLLKFIPAKRWKVLIADREFIGKDWFDFLRLKRIKRCIRIKESTQMDEHLAKDAFKNLAAGEIRGLFDKAIVYGSIMQVVATKSPEGERVMVASDLPIDETLEVYRERWKIECSFSALKSRGLGLEETHMTAPDRIGRLFGFLSVGLMWMVLAGEWRSREKPIKVKKHGHKAKSMCTYGLEVLAEALRWAKPVIQTLLALLVTPFSRVGQLNL
jgi:hypothetical protein